MRILLLAAAERGNRIVDTILSQKDFYSAATVFTFREAPWEPRFVEDIRETTERYNVPMIVSHKVNDPKNRKFFNNIDLILVSGWRYLLPKELYNLAKIGCFVFHDSLLPEYRGFGPTVWSIRNGERCTGTSLFKIAERMDEGELVDQVKIKIHKDDYIADVMEKVTKANLKILKRTLPKIAKNSFKLTKQNNQYATYCCKTVPEDFRIDWTVSAGEIVNLVKSYSDPYPGAFCFFQDQKIRVLRASLVSDNRKWVGSVPGALKAITSEGVSFFAGSGSVLIEKVRSNGIIYEANEIFKSIESRLK